LVKVSMNGQAFVLLLTLHGPDVPSEVAAISFQESDACHRVGYLSSSQFSREYARFFGNAPTRDIARVREEGVLPQGQ